MNAYMVNNQIDFQNAGSELTSKPVFLYFVTDRPLCTISAAAIISHLYPEGVSCDITTLAPDTF